MAFREKMPDGTTRITGGPVGGGINGGVAAIIPGTHIDVDATDIGHPIISAVNLVDSVQAGTNVEVDNSDPDNPIINVPFNDIADRFENTDTFVATGPGDQTFYLTYVPKAGSLHVRWEPLNIPISRCTVVDNVLTIADPDNRFRAGHEITAAYAVARSADPAYIPPVAGPLFDFEASGWKHYQTYAGDLAMYNSPSYDDSAWAVDSAPFGDTNPDHQMSNFHGVTWPDYVSAWSQGTRMWARRAITPVPGVAMLLSLRWNRYIVAYWNGVQVYAASTSSAGVGSVVIPAGSVTGADVLAIRITDDPYTGSGTGCYFDAKVEQ